MLQHIQKALNHIIKSQNHAAQHMEQFQLYVMGNLFNNLDV